MKQTKLFVPIILVALSLLACRTATDLVTGGRSPTRTPTPDLAPAVETQISPPPATPTAVEAAASMPAATAPAATGPAPTEPTPADTTAPPAQPTPTSGEAAPPPRAERPPQSSAAQVRPEEMRLDLTRLTYLIGYQIAAVDGAILGTAADYIINTCETYIVYIAVEPALGRNVASESRALIPFEAATVNSGILDAQTKTITLHLTPEQVAAAPTVPVDHDLFPNDWEAGVRDYWKQIYRISGLSTECKAISGVVHKVAYASRLLGAPLRDGLQNPLGTIEEAILTPEAGKLSFFVVRLEEEQAWVLVPLSKFNIPREALEPGAELSLVLLTENHLLLNAPRLASLDEAATIAAQNSARAHWR